MKTKTQHLHLTLRVILCLLAFCLLSFSAKGQTYTLDECIQRALDNNIQVLNSALDQKSSAFKIRETKAALLPSIDLNTQYMYYMQMPSQYAPASAFGGPEGEYTKMNLNMAQTATANVQLTQSFFNKTALTGLQAARVYQEASNVKLLVTRENVIYNVTATYYTIQVLKDNQALLAGNIGNLEKTVNINANLKENELLSENVYNRLLINLENLRNQYENQKLTLIKNTELLKYLMNVPATEVVDVVPFDYNDIPTEPLLANISKRPDLRLQETQIKLSRFDKKVIEAGFFPVMTGRASYGYTSYYDEFSPSKQINNDWINSSYFSLSMKLPLFDGALKRNQIRQKEITIRKDINTMSMMEANAEKEVQEALSNYTTQKTLLASNKTTLHVAEQLFNTSQGEYNNGITSLTELMNAQNDLSNARNNYSAALLNLKLADLQLRKANGTLLSSN